MHRFATPRAVLAALVLGGTLAAAAVAYSAIPDSSGAIQACYGSTGQLRAAADCRGAETSVALGGPTYGFEPGGGSRFPSESVALQTSLVLPSDGSVVMTGIRPEGGAGTIARHRKLDAVRVDGLTTTG